MNSCGSCNRKNSKNTPLEIDKAMGILTGWLPVLVADRVAWVGMSNMLGQC